MFERDPIGNILIVACVVIAVFTIFFVGYAIGTPDPDKGDVVYVVVVCENGMSTGGYGYYPLNTTEIHDDIEVLCEPIFETGDEQ
ncbi:hypothetical protein ACOZ35_03290 [Halorubrum xinjiangense]|uniref:hypothetical protein n=1 Tax=Halorubrum xinjiangense TaxID=261291 RepID=UPI003C6FC0BD